MGAEALYDSKLFDQNFHLGLDLAILGFEVLILRRIHFLVVAMRWYMVALILFW